MVIFSVCLCFNFEQLYDWFPLSKKKMLLKCNLLDISLLWKKHNVFDKLVYGFKRFLWFHAITDKCRSDGKFKSFSKSPQDIQPNIHNIDATKYHAEI